MTLVTPAPAACCTSSRVMDPPGPGAGQPAQVHAQLPGQLADRRLGQHAQVAARRTVGAGGRGLRNGADPGRCLARPPGGRAGLDPVADQHGLPLRGRRNRRDQVLRGGPGAFSGDRSGISGLRRRAGCRSRGPASRRAGHVHRDDRGAHVHGLALGYQQRGHHPRVRAGQLDDGLGRLDVHDDLVHGHRVARLHPPADDVRLGQALAHVGEAEFPALGGDGFGHGQPPFRR